MNLRKLCTMFLSIILIAMLLNGCRAEPPTTAEPPSAETVEADNGDDGVNETNGASGFVSSTGIPMSAPGVLPITEAMSTITVLIPQVAHGLTDITTNEFTRELEELTNVHLDMIVVPGEVYRDRMNLLLASDDYPEVFMGAGLSNADLVMLGTIDNFLIPLNDLIETHGYHIKQLWDYNPMWRTDMTAPNGNIYGIPSIDSGGMGHGVISHKLWINELWLENLGLDRPTTTDEFRAVLEAFRDGDPTGTGSQVIPMTGAVGTWAAEIHLFLINAFGYWFGDSLLKVEGDSVLPTANADYVREAMEFIHGLYVDGLIDPAAFTQNEQQLSALGNYEGGVLVGAVTCGHIGMFVSVENVERISQYNLLMPLMGPNGYRGIPKNPGRASGAAFVITDRAENPEIAMRLADTLMDEEMIVRMQVGIKGVHWDDADPGTFGVDGVTPATRQFIDYHHHVDANYNWAWTNRLLEPDWKGTFQVVGDIRDPDNYESFLTRYTHMMFPYAATATQMPPNFMSEADATRISQILPPLQDFVRSSIVEFITGARCWDADWQAYLDGLDRLNYSEYIEIMQGVLDELR